VPFLRSSVTTERGATVALSGELDVASVDRIRGVLLHVSGQDRCVVVDMSDVTFMDCAALRALLAVRRDLRWRGGDLTLTGVSGMPARVLHITKCQDLLQPTPMAGTDSTGTSADGGLPLPRWGKAWREPLAGPHPPLVAVVSGCAARARPG